MKKILLFIMAIAITTNVAVAQNNIAPQQKKTLERKYSVKVGEQIPDFTVTLSDGTTKKISDFRGKVVMIQFTATWCGICINEMPHIEKDIWQKHKSNSNFELLGVMLKQGSEKDVTFMREKTGVTYPLVFDLDGSAFGSLTEKGAGVTRNIIIDKNGKIICLTRGFDEEEFSEMKKIIDKELASSK